MQRKTAFLPAAVLVGLLAAHQAQAHMFWLVADRDTPAPGQTVQVEVGWGHKFPRDEEIKAERLASVKVMDAQGRELSLTQVSPTLYEFVPSQAGVYLVLAQVAPDFLSKTPEGFKLQSKQDLPEALFCFRFDMTAKTVLTTGPTAEGFDRNLGAPLEIIPLSNPAALATGQTLALRVMFQGEPLPDAEVKVIPATSASPAAAVAAAKTDARGEARTTLHQPGRWLFHVTHKTPYAPPEECDEHSYSSSLTVNVR